MKESYDGAERLCDRAGAGDTRSTWLAVARAFDGLEARFRGGAEVYCRCFVVSIPSCLTTQEGGQEGLDTLMVLAQLGSGQYTIVS